MKLRIALSALSLATATAVAVPAFAGEPKNLTVIAKDTKEKDLEKAMKAITKGLGVKCEACHVKGKFDSDDVKSKVGSRDFFKITMGTKDQAARDAALADLLKLLEIKEAKDTAQIWSGIDQLKLQPK